jgi:hypothetical protein
VILRSCDKSVASIFNKAPIVDCNSRRFFCLPLGASLELLFSGLVAPKAGKFFAALVNRLFFCQFILVEFAYLN